MVSTFNDEMAIPEKTNDTESLAYLCEIITRDHFKDDYKYFIHHHGLVNVHENLYEHLYKLQSNAYKPSSIRLHCLSGIYVTQLGINTRISAIAFRKDNQVSYLDCYSNLNISETELKCIMKEALVVVYGDLEWNSRENHYFEGCQISES